MVVDDCPMNRFCKIVGSKWGCIIVGSLARNGEMGFNELLRLLKTNPRTLSSKLKGLEKSSLIRRRVLEGERPIRVMYSLTKKGEEAKNVSDYISQWMKSWEKG
jgi:DNA-binding HxlR family transcriptional regulator